MYTRNLWNKVYTYFKTLKNTYNFKYDLKFTFLENNNTASVTGPFCI